MRILIYAILLVLVSCGGANTNDNYLGYVKELPKGTYMIKNQGSRHIVRCYREDGKYYNLNDANFKINGISGYDAHQYRELTKIIVK